jgi:hypothetical protein
MSSIDIRVSLAPRMVLSGLSEYNIQVTLFEILHLHFCSSIKHLCPRHEGTGLLGVEAKVQAFK